MPRRFLRHEGRVDTTQNHRDTPLPEVIGQLVRPRGRPRNRADADQIRLGVEVDIGDALVDDRDLGAELFRHKRGERGQRKRRIAQ